MRDSAKGIGIISLALFATIVMVYAIIPNNTLQNNWLVITNINVTGTYMWAHNGTVYNMTTVVSSLLGVNATNEWGLVYGKTGDWFNYTELQGAVPVYINLHMFPSNETIAGEKVIPQVYDKNANAWQLAIYWMNGTQYTRNDPVLVMYYAHIEWDNPTGETYILPNGQEPA